MCKSLQFLMCTRTCMLGSWLTKIRNVTNAIYILAQSVPYTLVRQLQFSNNLLKYKKDSGPKLIP